MGWEEYIMNPMTPELFLSVYSLARMFYYHGSFNQAEKLASGLQALDDKNPLPKLILAAINFEKGNYSLSANYYRILAQDPAQALIGRLGLLAAFVALKDTERASSLSEELKNHLQTMTNEQQEFHKLYTKALNTNTA